MRDRIDKIAECIENDYNSCLNYFLNNLIN